MWFVNLEAGPALGPIHSLLALVKAGPDVDPCATLALAADATSPAPARVLPAAVDLVADRGRLALAVWTAAALMRPRRRRQADMLVLPSDSGGDLLPPSTHQHLADRIPAWLRIRYAEDHTVPDTLLI